jgi:hypothetical protein
MAIPDTILRILTEEILVSMTILDIWMHLTICTITDTITVDIIEMVTITIEIADTEMDAIITEGTDITIDAIKRMFIC